jgi:CubicO group peptidase (beta-lactamase class C family)
MKKIFLFLFTALFILCPVFPASAEDFPPASPESQGISSESLKKLSDTVEAFLETDQIVGAELVVIKNRHTVLHDVFGWRDREDKAAMEKNTRFNLRSMTKPLTGAAAQILIDEGKLALNDRVSTYLPGFRNAGSEAITVQQLLTHRSGLPLSILTSVEEMKKHPDLISVANATGERGPQFEPDEKFWYSDAGSEVLGAVIEVVSGMSVDRFVTERLLTPLKMTNSCYVMGNEAVDDPAVASLYGGGAGAWKRFWKPGDTPFYPFALGSQSLYGTPQDYARFLAMLMDGGRSGDTQPLTKEAVGRILTPASPMSTLGSDMSMPTGFPGCKVFYGQMAVLYLNEKSDSKKPVVFGHTGSDGTYAWAWPDHDLMVFFFTQSRGSSSGLRLETEIHNLLIDPDGAPGTVVPEGLQPFLGNYSPAGTSSDGPTFKVLFQNGNLAVDVPGQMAFDLNGPDDSGQWTFKISGDVHVSFSRDESGAVEGMRIAQLIKIMQDKMTAEEEIPEDVPEEYRPWLGTYPFQVQGITLTVLFQDGNLVINDPSEGPIKLEGPDEEGLWIDQFDKNQIYFEKDAKGRTVLNVIANTRLTKLK